jgi:DNA topoisomerase I
MKILNITGLRVDAHISKPGSRGGHIVGYRAGEPIYGKAARPAKKATVGADKGKAREEKWQALLASKSPEDRKAYEAAHERGLVLRPNLHNVWINPDKNAGLQAKGLDDKNRMQYHYSVTAENEAAAKKFNRLKSFNAALPQINARIDKDFDSRPEAQVLSLIAKTGFRVGGEKDTKAEKKAYGASTLTADHVNIAGSKITFNFVGKNGKQQQHVLNDAALASVLSKRTGKLFDTTPDKVRAYMKEISAGGNFKVKDFRTHTATAMALSLVGPPPPAPKTEREKQNRIMDVARKVSAFLGNTPKMARDAYIDPAVFQRLEVA